MTITFVTTTSYGTWLPGDLRGYVRKGQILPANPELHSYARKLMRGAPVYFSAEQRDCLLESLLASCAEFDYKLSNATVESWHLHWILWHDVDSIETVVGRLKTRMRQALRCGRIWTAGFCGELLFDEIALEQAQEYIARHDGCRMSGGRMKGRLRVAVGRTPGRAGG